MLTREAVSIAIAIGAGVLALAVWREAWMGRLNADFGRVLFLLSAEIVVNSIADILPGPSYISWVAYGLAVLLLLLALHQLRRLFRRKASGLTGDST